MASTYSTNLKLELMTTGENSGTWGDTTNTNLGTLLEQAIVGFTTQPLAGAGPTALTIPDGATGVGRYYVIEFTGSPTSGHNVTVPAVQKSYIIFNNTGGNIVFKVSGQTGVTIASGKKAIVYNNGTDVIEVVNAPVTESGTQTLTNKTLTTPVIASISNGGTVTIPSGVRTLVARDTTDTLTNKTISVDDNTVSGIAASSFVVSNASGNIDGGAAQKVIPTGTVVGTTDTQTMTNKRIDPRVTSGSSTTSPLAWNSDNYDEYAYTALANALTFSADAGTPVDGQKIIFRVQDNGTARVLTFTGGVGKGFEPVGVTMTASGSDWTYTTTINKKVYIGCIYNSSDTRWDIVAIAQEA